MDGPRRDAPVLIINPANDLDLAALARNLMMRRSLTLKTLEAELRLSFPNLVVHSRDLAGETTPIWYVYREGHWVPSEAMARLLTREGLTDARD
jgi:hypothetical protein